MHPICNIKFRELYRYFVHQFVALLILSSTLNLWQLLSLNKALHHY
jgi:hypothetical protein